MTEGQGENGKPNGVSLPVVNRLGLHARAAAKIAETVKCYQCTVSLEKDGRQADGDSVLSLLALDAPQGSSVWVVAAGPQADEALTALQDLFARRFGEEH